MTQSIQRVVKFFYHTGVIDDLFENATLTGSWDSSGWSSAAWSEMGMRKLKDLNGTWVFVGEMTLRTDNPHRRFYWGVKIDGPAGRQQWAIPTEEQDPQSQRCHRSFELGHVDSNEQHYFLSHSRRLGAQRHGRGIRFSVWAPNALKVEVCIGHLWQQQDEDSRTSLLDPTVTPALRSVDRNSIRGGYIADSGAGEHPNWGPFRMSPGGGGVWVTDSADPGLADYEKFGHVPYMYKITRDNGLAVYRTDLFSRCQIGGGATRPVNAYNGLVRNLDGTVSCSIVVDPDLVTEHFSELNWPETEWIPHDQFFAPGPRSRNRRTQDLVLYELHVGALGFHRSPQEPGTLEDACGMLDYLEDLGVNAIELLPLSEFGGDGAGWGYATSHYYAIEYAGGGRDQYKWFIRECHRRGISVILDVVYNHFNHQADRAEWMFDSTSHETNSYYWYQGRAGGYPEFDHAVGPSHAGEGGYVDNVSSGWAPRYWEQQVRNLFIGSALALALEFQVDGFRVDQTTSIRSYNVLHANGQAILEANAFGAKLLRELTRSLRLVSPGITLMAEDHGDPHEVTRAPDRGGLGFDAAWYADFYHHLIRDGDKGPEYAKLIKNAGRGDERALDISLFAAALQATNGGSKVVYHESHDEAGNGEYTDRTICVAVNGAPLVGETRKYAEARCRFAAGVTILSAGIPMFLFGEEVGAQKKFLYNHVLENREDYKALRHGSGRSLFEYYRQLIRLRLQHPGLRSTEIDVVFTYNQDRLIVFRRWGDGEEFLIVGSLNNRPFVSPSYQFRGERIPKGLWRELFNSDAAEFGGSQVGNRGMILANSYGTFECAVPANGIVVFKSESC